MDDVRQLEELVKKLQHEKLSAQNLSNELREDVRELTKELLSLKKENLSMRADTLAVHSTESIPNAATNDGSSASTVTTAIDSKHSGQSNKTNQ